MRRNGHYGRAVIGRGRRLLVVEDDALTASLLCDALRAQGFEVGTSATVGDALVAVERFDPDAALLDINLGDGPSGVDLGHVLDRTRPDVALVFLTKHPDFRTAGVVEDDLPAGCGFLSKDRVRDTEYLAEAIDAVLAERARDVRHNQDPSKPLGQLTAKQLEIMRLIAMGYTNESIAAIRGVGRSSVERWAKEIFQRLGIDTAGELNPRVEATRMFIEAAGLPRR